MTAADRDDRFEPLTRGVFNRYVHCCGFIEMVRQDIDAAQEHLHCRACKSVEPGGWSILYIARGVES